MVLIFFLNAVQVYLNLFKVTKQKEFEKNYL